MPTAHDTPIAAATAQIEDHVARTVRTRRDSVATREGAGRWRFNREIFDAILSQIDPEAGGTASEAASSGGPRSLGGAPLTIDVLRRLDGAFTFDNVARRITRDEVQVRAVALQQLVEEGVDLSHQPAASNCGSSDLSTTCLANSRLSIA